MYFTFKKMEQQHTGNISGTKTYSIFWAMLPPGFWGKTEKSN